MNILFHLPNKIRNGIYNKGEETPKELFYGSDILSEKHDVNLNEERFDSIFSHLPGSLTRNGIGPLSPNTIKMIYRSDVIIIKDLFSMPVSLTARLLGKKVIYLDTMFEIPRHKLTRWIYKKCIEWSYLTLSFSVEQNKAWVTELRLPANKLKALPFCIDFNYYDNLRKPRKEDDKQFLAIGRDPGRDYIGLVKCFTGLNAKLQLVTMAYLLPEKSQVPDNVTLPPTLTYQEISELYCQSTAHIIPLKQAYTYPSGIRAVLESLAFKIPVITTNTPVLREYFSTFAHFLEAGDIESLSQLVEKWSESKLNIDVDSAYDSAKKNHDYSVYCRQLIEIIDKI